MKLFNIVISEVIFNDFKKDLISKGGELISVEERALPKTKGRNNFEKLKYYYSKYWIEKRRLDNKRITKKEFEKRIKLLKELREKCKTKSEFLKKHERIRD